MIFLLLHSHEYRLLIIIVPQLVNIVVNYTVYSVLNCQWC